MCTIIPFSEAAEPRNSYFQSGCDASRLSSSVFDRPAARSNSVLISGTRDAGRSATRVRRANSRKSSSVIVPSWSSVMPTSCIICSSSVTETPWPTLFMYSESSLILRWPEWSWSFRWKTTE